MSRDRTNYTHGDTGTKPSSLNFESNDRPNSEYFDWWWSTIAQAVDGHADEFDRLDSDNDGKVDAAESADTANLYKGNDIDTDGDGVVDRADEADTVGGTDINTDYASEATSTTVDDGDGVVVYQHQLDDGEAMNVYQATFMHPDGTVLPSGLDFTIASLDGSGGSTLQTTILDADGTSVLSDETGDPLASYTNSTGSPQQIAIVIDNGQYGTGAGQLEPVYASFKGRVN